MAMRPERLWGRIRTVGKYLNIGQKPNGKPLRRMSTDEVAMRKGMNPLERQAYLEWRYKRAMGSRLKRRGMYPEDIDAEVGRNWKRASNARELKRHATKDPLTGLWNRRMFEDELKDRINATKAAMEHHRRNVPALFTLLFMDVNGFKKVNDRHGHKAGDRVLQEFADVLRHSTRGYSDRVYRWGGDEFAALVPGSVGEALRVSEHIHENIRKSPGLKDVSGSIGIVHHDGSMAPEEIVRLGDSAMYVAKSKHRRGEIGTYLWNHGGSNPEAISERD